MSTVSAVQDEPKEEPIAAFLSPEQLRARLRSAGVSLELIDAAWPQWWSDDAAGSPSADAELRFTLARRLGLSASSLLEEEPVFVFRNAAKFKSLAVEAGQDEAALASYGLSVARLLTAATSGGEVPQLVASELRSSILHSWKFVTLESLLTLCWAIGVPVAFLRVFPLDAKRMHAMSVRVDQRYAILLGRDTTFPAALAFTLAHEIGHIALGHFGDQSALVDFGDPAADMTGLDDEEDAATRFALELLTGDELFEVDADRAIFNSAQLAESVMRAGETVRIEPSMLALAAGHATGRWTQAVAAMKLIGATDPLLIDRVNGICRTQLDWDLLSDDEADYLERLIRSDA